MFVTTRGLDVGHRSPVRLLASRSGHIEQVCATRTRNCENPWLSQMQSRSTMLFLAANTAIRSVETGDAHTELRKHQAITDALRREDRGKEPRVAIAVGEVKQSLVTTNSSTHNVMNVRPADEAVAQSQTYSVWSKL